ncbi:MAG: DNA recombination protein RmuC [Patescibacteria group bacterium]
MNYIFLAIIIVGAGIVAMAVLFTYFFRHKDGKENQALLMLQNQLTEITRTLDTKLGESTKAMQGQFGESAKIIRDVTERLAKFEETNRQVVNFAEQLQSLQDILQNPKQRGVLGEYYLETVLKNVLPPGRFQMQYKFADGEIVDAVIFLDQGKVLPIDSKFSLENYNRILGEHDKIERERLEKVFKQDLKNRIDETSKYIRPKEGTMDFAFMFIPSEAIYYDLLINQVGAVKSNTRDLIEYAFGQKHVIIVSPTSFMAYLQTVLQGLRALKIEESAKEIRKSVEELERHLGNYGQFVMRLGNNLGTTVNTFNAARSEFAKINKDFLHITGKGMDSEIKQLDKPEELS